MCLKVSLIFKSIESGNLGADVITLLHFAKKTKTKKT